MLRDLAMLLAVASLPVRRLQSTSHLSRRVSVQSEYPGSSVEEYDSKEDRWSRRRRMAVCTGTFSFRCVSSSCVGCQRIGATGKCRELYLALQPLNATDHSIEHLVRLSTVSLVLDHICGLFLQYRKVAFDPLLVGLELPPQLLKGDLYFG